MACVGLVLFSGIFFLFPRRRSGSTEAELDAANLAWYRQRKQELESQGESVLLEDARLRLLEDEHRHDAERLDLPATTAFSAWFLLPLIGLGAGLLYYELGAVTDVELAQRLQGIGESSSPSEMRQLISDVEQRSIKRPDNLHYLALLGRYYIGQQEYGLARENYRQMLREVPEDAQILAYSAQAEFFAAGRTLTDEARLRAEQALAVDPQQRTALGMLGMALYEQGDYAAAIGYWERLLAMETPGSESASMIRSVLDSARLELGEGEAALAEPAAEPNAQAESVAIGITAKVTAPQGVTIAPSDTVFILARSASSGSRMPIAVQRLQGITLPLTVRLDDRHSMAGQKLSQSGEVIVAVQVSADGRPGEKNARWLGEVVGVTPSAEGEPIEVLLRPGDAQ